MTIGSSGVVRRAWMRGWGRMKSLESCGTLFSFDKEDVVASGSRTEADAGEVSTELGPAALDSLVPSGTLNDVTFLFFPSFLFTLSFVPFSSTVSRSVCESIDISSSARALDKASRRKRR